MKVSEKGKFWIKMSITAVFGILIPLLYLIIRHNLFQTQIKITLGLWGLIAILFVALAITVLIKFYVSGLKTKWTLGKQIVEGFVKLIMPIAIFIVALNILKDYSNQLLEFCWVLIPCEIIAVIVNPLPKWAFDNNVEGLGEITDKVFSRGKNNTTEGGETQWFMFIMINMAF